MQDEDGTLITATEASRSFSDMLHRVCYGGESFIIKKGNRLMARLVPVEVPVIAEEDTSVPEVQEMRTPVAEIMTAAASIPADESEFYQAWMEQVRKVPTLID